MGKFAGRTRNICREKSIKTKMLCDEEVNKLILAIIFFVVVSFAFLYLIYKYEKKNRLYATRNCREARANLGMFTYKTKVEANRKCIQSKAKF